MWNVIKSMSYQLAPKHISSRPLTIATNTDTFIKHVLVVFFYFTAVLLVKVDRMFDSEYFRTSANNTV